MNGFPVVMKDGVESPWLALKIHSSLANKVEDIDRNIENALGLQYIPLQELFDAESGAVSVVGSGPSLKENWKALRDFDGDIVACNASFQFLLDKGIVPKYMFCFDADPLMLEFITPRPDVTYLIGSRCPPKTFELLAGCKVVAWHAGGDPNIESLLQKHGKVEPIINGGTAAITRAMMIVQTLGYTEVHLWGADSSFKNGDTHIRKSTTDEMAMTIMVGGKPFQCAPWMAQQAEDFKLLAPPLRDRYHIKLVVHGEGLIPYIASLLGFETDLEKRYHYLLRQAKHKAKTIWQHL